MAATIPSKILGLPGQCVKHVSWDEARGAIVFHCDRDRRFVPVDHRTGARGVVNRRLRHEVADLPICSQPVMLDIAYCQLKIGAVDRRMERLDFVAPGAHYTYRFGRLVGRLCRHMPLVRWPVFPV